MFIKINTKNKQKLAINKFFHLLPPAILGVTTLIFSFATLLFSQIKTFAAPGTPPAGPGILAFSVNNPTIDLHFTSSEIQSNTFKSDLAVLWCNAPNLTGFSVLLSSIDEDTSLKHSESSVTAQIPSITAPQLGSISTPQTWGYRIPNRAAEGWKPIPKNSNPDNIYTTNIGGATKIGAEFGVKTSSNLPSGVYSKQVVFTLVTNRVPTTATLKPGKAFRFTANSLGRSSGIKEFKKASSAPAPGTSTEIVSTTDSEMPVYLWYDAPSKTVFWWSDADTVYANEDSNAMFSDLGDVERIDVTGINTSRVKDMSWMFHSYEYLYKHIELGNFDTSNAEDMRYMFGTHGMKTMENIDPIDFSSFDTSKVTNMESMFEGSFLPSIDIHNFNTSNVTNMSFMFAHLGRPTTLNLSGLDVRSLWNTDAFFGGGSRNMITSLNVSGWDVSHLNDTVALFAGMENLEYLNLQDFKTTSIISMGSMFEGTKKLKNLDLSSFDTSQVTNMSSMFKGMESLTTINLSSFDTRNVTNMKNMFYRAFMTPENSIIDVSSFDTRNVTNMEGMFYTKAKTIYTSPSFVTTAITTTPHDPFIDNSNLTGGNGTTWDSSKRDHVYARIDTPGNPGFFTQKP